MTLIEVFLVFLKHCSWRKWYCRNSEYCWTKSNKNILFSLYLYLI